MAGRRPSWVSIRVRQTNIVEGMVTGGLTPRETARRLGVRTSELRNFLRQRPQELRSNYNRSPAHARLFAAGDRPNVRRSLGLRGGVTRFERSEHVTKDMLNITKRMGVSKPGRRYNLHATEMLRRYYYKGPEDKSVWAWYAWEHGLPISIREIKSLYYSDRLKFDRYREIVEFWRDLYRPSQSTYELYRVDR